MKAIKQWFKENGKALLKWLLAAIVTLPVPVILWNVILLDYINAHGKFWVFILTPVWSALSAWIIVGLSDVKKKLVGATGGREGAQINPFWGWFAVAMIIELFIAFASNT